VAAEDDRTAGRLVDELTADTAHLVRAELARGRREVVAKAREAGRGAALLGGAGLLGALAAGTSAAVVVRVLGTVLPRPAAALVATVLYAGGAAALGVAGVEELKRIGPLLPEETIAGVRDDLRAARDAAARS